MHQRIALDFWDCAGKILRRLRVGGVLCTVVDCAGHSNVLTLGWGQIGPFYHGHPVFSIAITPLRYSWRFLAEVPEFVIGVPNESLQDAVRLCGVHSGRDEDKFVAAGLTRLPAAHIRAPTILECPINVECRVYSRIHPPHTLLTPEHRQRPVEEQHTIYFAEVLGTYGWEG